MKRNTWITLFVLAWITVFHYETLRLRYLSPLVGRELPKLKFLYPPAGWIMFYTVDRSYGMAEAYGVKQGRTELLDPHAIFSTRAVGYDNIRRNVLVTVLSPHVAPQFCGYLQRKFTTDDAFSVVYAVYPDLVDAPAAIRRYLAYQCP